MDTNNTPPQGLTPGSQPDAPHHPVQPIGRRPMVDGFAPRRPLQPMSGPAPARPLQPQPGVQSGAALAPRTAAAPQTIHVAGLTPAVNPAAPQTPLAAPAPQARPVQPAAVPQAVHSDFLAPPRPAAPAITAASAPTTKPAEPTTDTSAATGHPPREKNRTGHAGLIGFIVFILLGALLLSPFVPGKIVQSFPFASSSVSTGEQSLDCIGTQGRSTTSTSYDTKAGAPITYTYSTSTDQTATCDGQTQHATIGHASQFNPLGLVVDIAAALVAAIVIARIWRLIFGEKRHGHKSRPRES